MNGKISIIMGIYNCSETLPEAIESILAQTYENWELIMCDDCSTDDTYKVAERYKNKYPDKIILVQNEKNSKLAFSLNHCLEMATGKYVARMDGDDISKPTRFEKQLAYMKLNSDVGILGSHMELINDNGVVLKEQHKKMGRMNIKLGLFFGNTSLAHPSILIKKSELDKSASLKIAPARSASAKLQ